METKIMTKTSEFVKNDDGKLKYDLIPPSATKALARVLTFGAAKYEKDNWRKGSIDRYVSALYRHLAEWRDGEPNDSESGYSHLDHAICNIAFLIELEKGEADTAIVRAAVHGVYHWYTLRFDRQYNENLYFSLMTEEYVELCTAIKTKNLVEVLDAIGDLLFVYIGGRWSQGYSASDTIRYLASNESFLKGLLAKQITWKGDGNLLLYTIVAAVSKSNHTKSVKKIPEGEKYSSEGKGPNYVPPTKDLEELITRYSIILRNK